MATDWGTTVGRRLVELDAKRKEFVNLRAVLAGVSLVVTFVLVSEFLGATATSTPEYGPFKRLLGTLFVGLSTGFYVGRAVGKEGGPIDSFLIGFFGSVAFIVVFVTRLSVLTGILVFTAATSFLMYNSGLVESNEEIEQWIGALVAISLYGVVILVFLQYAWPVVVDAGTRALAFLSANPIYVPVSAFTVVVAALLFHRLVGWDRVWDAGQQFVSNRLRRFVP